MEGTREEDAGCAGKYFRPDEMKGLAECSGTAGMISVLAERAASEGPRSTRAAETTPAAPLKVENKNGS
jgi:hypothetical protein